VKDTLWDCTRIKDLCQKLSDSRCPSLNSPERLAHQEDIQEISVEKIERTTFDYTIRIATAKAIAMDKNKMVQFLSVWQTLY